MNFLLDVCIYLFIMFMHELMHGLVIFFFVSPSKIAGIKVSTLGIGVETKPVILDLNTARNFYVMPVVAGLVIMPLVAFIVPTFDFIAILIAYIASCSQDFYELYKLRKVKA